MTDDEMRVASYLGHITTAIERIFRYTEGMAKADFLSNDLVQDAVIRNFEVIGEASNNIEKRYPEFAAEHPDLPLSIAYQMRNALAHGHFKIDHETVWRAIQRDLPGLYQQVRKISVAKPDEPGGHDCGL